MAVTIWHGIPFYECGPYPPRHHGHCYEPFHGCYGRHNNDWCNTVHVRLWVNAPTGIIPPVSAPTWEGRGDWSIDDQRRLLIVPGLAMVGSAGIGTMGTTSYVLIVDDATGQPMAWYQVNDWSFTTAPTGPTTDAVDWIALDVSRPGGTVGYVGIPALTPVASVEGVDLTQAAITRVYTVPAGKRFIYLGLTMRLTEAVAPVGDVVMQVIRASDSALIYSPGGSTPVTLDAVEAMWQQPATIEPFVDAGDSVDLEILTPDSGSGVVATYDLFGYLVEA